MFETTGATFGYRAEELIRNPAWPLKRTETFAAIGSGELPAHKRGRATILLHADIVKFLQNLPLLKISKDPVSDSTPKPFEIAGPRRGRPRKLHAPTADIPDQAA